MVGGLVTDGLVEAEKQKNSGMTTGILEAGGTGARIQLIDTGLTFFICVFWGVSVVHLWLSDLDGHSGYKFY